jgi:hypothetical protein
VKEPFLPYLPVQKIRIALAKAPGNELDSGKISSPESSAVLAANIFGLFLDRPSKLPAIPGTESFEWPADFVGTNIAHASPGQADDNSDAASISARR